MTTNTMFPGRPRYVGPKTGIFGLLHHTGLCESSHDVMERVAYVKKHKPKREIKIRLHKMIYLGRCKAAAKRDALCADYETKRAPLYADYETKRAPLYADYWAKRNALDAKIFAYIKKHIPDCAWNGLTLVFDG